MQYAGNSKLLSAQHFRVNDALIRAWGSLRSCTKLLA